MSLQLSVTLSHRDYRDWRDYRVGAAHKIIKRREYLFSWEFRKGAHGSSEFRVPLQPSAGRMEVPSSESRFSLRRVASARPPTHDQAASPPNRSTFP